MRFSFIFLYLLLWLPVQSQISVLDSIKHSLEYTDKNDLAEKLRKQGISLKNKGNYHQSILVLRESIKIFSSENNQIGMGNAYNNLGVSYFLQGNQEETLKSFYEAIAISKKANNDVGLGKIYLNLANYYSEHENFLKALEYYNKSKQVLININGTDYLLSLIHNGLGNILSNKNSSLYNLDKALDEFLNAIAIHKDSGDNKNLAIVYNNIGYLYEEKGDYYTALRYHNNSLQLKEELENKKGVLVSCFNIAQVHQHLDENPQALGFYERGKAIAIELQNGEMYLKIIGNMVKSYMALGEIDSASVLFREYDELKDSVYSDSKMEKLAKLETMYETKSKEQELQEQIDLAKKQNQQNQRLLATLAVLSVLVVVGNCALYSTTTHPGQVAR